MTLEQILHSYKTERYKLYSDVYNNTKVSGLLGYTDYLTYFENYLGYYKTIDDTSQLIKYAVKGLFVNKGTLYIHPHQKVWRDKSGREQGIRDEVGNEVMENINENMYHFEKALETKSFDELYDFIREQKTYKFGGTDIYDTALRIGSKYDIKPKTVFLHAGSLIGLKALETKKLIEEDLSLSKTVALSEFPSIFKGMEAMHIEDFLCIKKVDLMRMGHG